MKSAIIAIGDELLIGQVVNTNAAFIGEKLTDAGIEVCRVVTVSDNDADILQSFRQESAAHDVVIVTGGLGPTHDDRTKKALCSLFDTDLVANPDALEQIKRLMETRRIRWTSSAEEQALVPRKAAVIPNRHGTAPGLLFESDGRMFVVLPGVPYEMEGMMDDFVVPYLKAKSRGNVILRRTLNTTGISESLLAERLGNLGDLLGDAKLAFLPSPSGVRLRISVTGSDRALCESKLKQIELQIRVKSGKYIYGVDQEELESVLGRLLILHSLKLAAAESCTGGMIAHRITNVPGSSQYFERGVVAYSNESKIDILGVRSETISSHGAVSKQVAEEMASGIRRIAGTDIGISTTGIAGPAGGTPEKPVGLVWLGYADEEEALAVQFNFGDNRLRVKERATQAALELVRRRILKIA